MKLFREFLFEASGQKLLHLEHIEDEILNSGKDGVRAIYNFLISLRNMLSGTHTSKAIVTTKWDGAPAVAVGEDPETGQFFVAYKSMKKLNFTPQDVKANFDNDALVTIYTNLLNNLKHLNIKGVVLQGDVLWSDPKQLSVQTIDNQSYVTFKPNTITYAVPRDSDLAKQMLRSKVGIVFHTSFPLKGAKNVDDLSANFGADISTFKTHPNVFVTSGEFSDVSAQTTFTKADTDRINTILSEILKAYRQIDTKYLTALAQNNKLKTDIKIFINQKVRSGEFIDGTKQTQDKLIEFLRNRYGEEVAKLKSEKGRAKKQLAMDQILEDLQGNAINLRNIFKIMSLVNNAKVHIIRKLEQVKSLTDTFVKTDTGFQVTKPEGFVAIDNNDKTKAVKLVDRLEFSRNNFNIAKNWDK